MSWKVFGGQNGELYIVLLKERLLRDGMPIDTETLGMQFRLHLHRLSRREQIAKKTDDFIRLAAPKAGDLREEITGHQ